MNCTIGTDKNNPLQKRRKRLTVVLVTVFVLLTSLFTVCDVYAASKVNIVPGRDCVLRYSDPSSFRNVAKKIGKMKIIKSKKFRTFYAKGNKMILGANTSPRYEKNEAYMYIENKGNKKVAFCGMKVGMTRAKANSVLLRAKLKKSTYSPDTYWAGECPLKLVIKNGKVAGWSYTVAPTG